MAGRQEGGKGRDAEAKGPGRPAAGDETPQAAKRIADEAKAIKGSRFALMKGRENLTERQKAKLDQLKSAVSRLFRAWELKEDLRAVYRMKDAAKAEALLDDWLHRAAYCKIPKVVEVEKKVRRRRDDILRSISLNISNARVESINNKQQDQGDGEDGLWVQEHRQPRGIADASMLGHQAAATVETKNRNSESGLALRALYHTNYRSLKKGLDSL